MYVYLYMYIHKNKFRTFYIRTYSMQACLLNCILASISQYTCDIYIYVCVCVCVCVRACVRACVCARARV